MHYMVLCNSTSTDKHNQNLIHFSLLIFDIFELHPKTKATSILKMTKVLLNAINVGSSTLSQFAS